jgi:hypothetical protein
MTGQRDHVCALCAGGARCAPPPHPAPLRPAARPQAASHRERHGGGAGAAAGGEAAKPDRLQAFACGLLAGLVAKLVSHPLDVAKKRYQVGGGGGWGQ